MVPDKAQLVNDRHNAQDAGMSEYKVSTSPRIMPFSFRCSLFATTWNVVRQDAQVCFLRNF
jgi:hypothetical protein